MGLDVYAGTMSRYVSRHWLQYRQESFLIHLSRLPINQGKPTIEELRTRLSVGAKERWHAQKRSRALQTRLRHLLGDRVPAPVQWNDDIDAAYIMGGLSWGLIDALRVWAAYALTPDAKPPLKTPSIARDDPVYARRSDDSDGPLCHFLAGAQLWVPGNHTLTVEGYLLGPKPVRVGWTGSLLADLDTINERTWRAPSSAVAEWSASWFDAPLDLLEPDAQCAFSVLHLAVTHAIASNGVVVLGG